jgi:AraC family transcriptional regulator, positive regulator of tynA and feaB
MRMLMAHVDTVTTCLNDLSAAGVVAARNALMELVKGALTAQVDGSETLLAPALAGAARTVLAGLLTEPDLNPEMLARELHVSVRSLHRTFAGEGESVMTYVRRQRLDQALRELSNPDARPTLTEVAARWGFSDSSHLIRACRREYDQTPMEHLRRHEM